LNTNAPSSTRKHLLGSRSPQLLRLTLPRANHHRQSRSVATASRALITPGSLAVDLPRPGVQAPSLRTGLFASLRGAPSSPANPSSVAVRSSATDPAGQVRAPRAKGKHGKDAGRVNGSAIGSTEDAARRRLAAARGGRGAPDRKRASATKGTQVNHTAGSARTPFLRTGFFAALPDSFRGGGSGARSSVGVGGRTSSLRLLASLALAVAAFLALAASSASAARGHVFKESFGTPGSGTGQLKEPSAVAVDEATHDVYVADSGNDRVDKFDSLALVS